MCAAGERKKMLESLMNAVVAEIKIHLLGSVLRIGKERVGSGVRLKR